MALEGEKRVSKTSKVPDIIHGTDPVTLEIEDDYSIHSILNAALNRAKSIGMKENSLSELEVIVKELVTNVITHGGNIGKVIISHHHEDKSDVLLLDVIDSGPGFSNFDKALEDGYSSSGSMGGGLPSIRRFSERVELINSSPKGSHIRVTKRVNFSNEDNLPWSFALFTRPFPGQTECGDQGTLIRNQEGILLVLADGLGHGPQAAHAAKKAIEVVQNSHRLQLSELIKTLDHQLKKTRGVAISLARIRKGTKKIEWVGIGNVSGRLMSLKDGIHLEQKVFANFNGTIGRSVDRYKILEYAFEDDEWLMIHSDGLTRNWMSTFIESNRGTPHEVGLKVIRENSRVNDDSSLLIGRPGK